MIERIRKKYAMTEKGAKDYVSAVFWSVLVNISKMLPVGVLATALSGIVEALTNGTDPGAGLTRFLVAGVLALASLFVTFLIQYRALYEATYRESANRRIRLAEVLRQLPLSFFGNRDLTDLTTTIMGDTETLEKAFSHFYPAMHGALISTALISAGMLLYDWRMALALLWVVPASLLMVYLSRRMEKRHITKGLVTRRAATDAMQEVLECAPEIKACNQKARYIADLNRRLDEAEQDTIRGELFTGSVVTAAQSFLKLGIATPVLTGVTLMSRGDLSLIPFLMFLIAATRVYDPIGSMFANMAAVFACEVRIERMQEIENEKRMTGLTEYDPDGYDIRFEHVTFAYREKEDVLRDVSFTAKQGQVTALVGPSGGGKSTAAKLAARFWDPAEGTVRLGGVDVSAVDGEALLKNYAIVFQDVVLFADTVMENIRLGKRDATDEEVLAAAKAAQCDAFVSKLPEGYHTLIGENGSRLSGGERRRLYLLSVLMEAPNVLLLDEPTNDLDVTTLSILEDYLLGFPGPILAVSHDRFFLDKLAESIFEVRGDGEIHRFTGNWTDWQAKRRAEEALSPKAEKPKPAAERPRERKLKFTFKEQREFETIDADLAELEAQITACQTEQESCGSDYVKLQELQARQAELEAALEEKTERWVYLNELKEQIDAQNG